MTLFAAVLLAAGLAAEPAEDGGRWAKRASSLLLYDSSGTVVHEIALESWEETQSGKLIVLESQGGTAPNGRFGWTLAIKTLWNQPKTKRLETRQSFRLYGTNGRELWSSDDAAFPESGEPAVFSADGETLLLATRRAGGWQAAAKSYIGNTLFEAGPFPTLVALDISPNGRYGLARWIEHDKSSTHTLLDIPAKLRKDIPSFEFAYGRARLTDDGKAYSGRRVIFDFTVSESTAASKAPKP